MGMRIILKQADSNEVSGPPGKRKESIDVNSFCLRLSQVVILTTFQKSLCLDGLSLPRTSRTMLSTSHTCSRTQSRRRSRRGPAVQTHFPLSVPRCWFPSHSHTFHNSLTSLDEIDWLDFHLPPPNHRAPEAERPWEVPVATWSKIQIWRNK